MQKAITKSTSYTVVLWGNIFVKNTNENSGSRLSFFLYSLNVPTLNFKTFSYANDSLNRAQLVPQGTLWCTSPWPDCGEWWVFPVFKSTYGLSEAVAEKLLFSFTTFSFLFHWISLLCFSWLCCQNIDQSFGSWLAIRGQNNPLETNVAKCILNLYIHHSNMGVTMPIAPLHGLKTTWVWPQNGLIYLTSFFKLGISTFKLFWGLASYVTCTANIKTHFIVNFCLY